MAALPVKLRSSRETHVAGLKKQVCNKQGQREIILSVFQTSCLIVLITAAHEK